MTNTESTKNTKATPIEVWLRQPHLAVSCTVVREDESTVELDVESLSLRGAMREITGYLISQGYQPAGRWDATGGDEGDESTEGNIREVTRRFRPTRPDATV
jgi:hypothetical protein